MSTDTALTMEELELESAELLPSRETLCWPSYCPPHCPPCGLSISVSVCVNIGCGNQAAGSPVTAVGNSAG